MNVLTKEQHVQVRNNLILYAFLKEETTERSIHLNSYRGFYTGSECGAVHCVGGWVAVHPYFQKMGIKPGALGDPTYEPTVTNGMKFNAVGIGRYFFGWSHMFAGQMAIGLPQKTEALARCAYAVDLIYYGETLPRFDDLDYRTVRALARGRIIDWPRWIKKRNDAMDRWKIDLRGPQCNRPYIS